MQFSVVIPVYNEGKNVERLTEEINQSLKPEHNFELLFVDDHSTDHTFDTLQKLNLAIFHFTLIRLARQYGQSGALSTGVQAAKFPLIVTLDGDGQNDPKDIEAFLSCFSEGGDANTNLLVNGHRTHRNDTGWRRLSSRIANWGRRVMLNDETPDSGCGIKAFHKKLFLDLPPFNHMHRFLPALVLQQGGTVVNIPVNHRKRSHGHSKYGTLDRLFCGIYDVLGVIWLGKRKIKTEILDCENING